MKYLPLDYADVAYEDIPAKYKALGAEITGYNLVFGTRSRGLMSGKIAEAIKAQVALLAASPAFRDQSGVTSAEAAELCANVLKRIGGMDGFDPTGTSCTQTKASWSQVLRKCLRYFGVPTAARMQVRKGKTSRRRSMAAAVSTRRRILLTLSRCVAEGL